MTKPQRILIVDDNPTNRDILQVLLTGHGYDVLHAGDGEEALTVATQQLPDLILLDIMMPKLDGIEVCRRLKGNAALPFMPIILLTAKSDSKDVVEGLDAGAEEYLSKPIDQPALVARVKALLRLKAQQDSNRDRVPPKVADATDLFISYSRQDSAKIETLAATLQRAGWSVWWDRQIRAGSSFDKAIEQALTNARAVIVAWSRHSVGSDWVRAEAAYALESNKLIPIRLDDAVPPLRFINVQSVDLSGWAGSENDEACRRLVVDLRALIGTSGRG
jgi:DNA-binding response OmpR family regulator